jgi:hypothetical protein
LIFARWMKKCSGVVPNVSEAVAPAERRFGTGHAGGGELHAEYGASHAVGGGGTFPHRELAGAGGAHGHVADGGDGDRVLRLRAVKAKQVAQTGSGADADAETLVPAFFAQLALHLDADEDFVGDHGCRDQAPAGDALARRHCEQRAECVARMPARIGVVEIKIADHARIDERRGVGGRLGAFADDAAGECGPRGGARQRAPDGSGFAIECAQRAAQRVEHALLAGVDGIGGQIVKAECRCEVGELVENRVQVESFGFEVASRSRGNRAKILPSAQGPERA